MQRRVRLLSIFLLLAVLAVASACRPTDPGADPTLTPAPSPTSIRATPTKIGEPGPTPVETPTPIETQAPALTPTSEPTQPTPDLEALRVNLAAQFNVPVDSVSVVSTELLPYPDLCLGAYDGSNCYRVTVEVEDNPYTYHANSAGETSLGFDSVPAQPGQIVLTFGSTDCQVGALRHDTAQVGLGPCNSEFSSFDFGGDPAATQAELDEMLAAFAPFTAVTSSGYLSFGGSGSATADAAQQEDIALWMRRIIAAAIAEGPADDALCSRLARPVLVTNSQGELAITDPFTQEECTLTLPGEFRGAMQAAGGFLYFLDFEGSVALVREMSPDGTLRPIEVTRTDSAQANLIGFVVSPDGRYIAWTTAPITGEPGMTTSLFLAETNGETVQTIVAGLNREDGRGMIPIAFDESSQTLVYALQPFGVGGAWPGFVGRYDSLYTVPVSASGSDNPGQLRFDCPALGLFICVGDFRLEQGELVAIAYADDQQKTIEIVDGQGAPISSISPDAEYVAYPTFRPDGELVYYTATLGEGEGGFPFAQPGSYYRLSGSGAAPYSAEPALVAQQDGLLTPFQWFDADHLIVGLADIQGSFGMGLLGIDGSITRLEPWPNTQVVTVIR